MENLTLKMCPLLPPRPRFLVEISGNVPGFLTRIMQIPDTGIFCYRILYMSHLGCNGQHKVPVLQLFSLRYALTMNKQLILMCMMKQTQCVLCELRVEAE